jgi:hypothetical protein
MRDENITLSASPSSLESSGSWVKVFFSGVQDPKKDDMIAVYSPTRDTPTMDLSKYAPLKFIYANRSKSYLQSGSGSYEFRLVNVRAKVYFAFFRNTNILPMLVAVSNPVEFKNYNEPLQQHLALTNKLNEMVVVWSSLNASNPMVRWGVAPGQYIYSSSSSWSTYTKDDMCGSTAKGFGWREPGLIHVAIMKNLVPTQMYYYQTGDEKYGWSGEFSFRAPPAPSPDVTTRVVAYGDMGFGEPDQSSEHWEEQPALKTIDLVTKEVSNGNVDVVLHIGDISYAVGYSAEWDQFFDQILPVASRVPYMVCIGNHERDYPGTGGLFNVTDSQGECGVPYERRFPMPRPSLDQPWYGFDYGSIHFVLMSTEHAFDPTSVQYKFLDAHLASIDRKLTPWVVFSGHRPMYIDSTNHDVPAGDIPVAKKLKEYVEPLLLKYSVDMALWGHHHSYQRTCPVAEEVCTEQGVTHVVIGMGGQGLSHNILPKVLKPSWDVVVDDQHWGYSRFTANATSLLFEFVRDSDAQVHDLFVLKRRS